MDAAQAPLGASHDTLHSWLEKLNRLRRCFAAVKTQYRETKLRSVITYKASVIQTGSLAPIRCELCYLGTFATQLPWEMCSLFLTRVSLMIVNS